nr:hypothetical protein [Tanacetum cinerariifolium]
MGYQKSPTLSSNNYKKNVGVGGSRSFGGSPALSRNCYKQKTNIGAGNSARYGGLSSLTGNGYKKMQLLEVFEFPEVTEVQRVLAPLVDQEGDCLIVIRSWKSFQTPVKLWYQSKGSKQHFNSKAAIFLQKNTERVHQISKKILKPQKAGYMSRERWGQGCELREYTLIEEDNRRTGIYRNRRIATENG